MPLPSAPRGRSTSLKLLKSLMMKNSQRPNDKVFPSFHSHGTYTMLTLGPSYHHEPSHRDMILKERAKGPSSLQQNSISQQACSSTVIGVSSKELTRDSGKGQSKKRSACIPDSTFYPLAISDAVPLNDVLLNVEPINASPMDPLDPFEVLKRNINSLGGTKLNLVIRKDQTKSDCKKEQGRLTMPCRQSSLLPRDSEQEALNGRDPHGKPCRITVEVIDIHMETWMLQLTKWDYDHSSSYVLLAWNELAKANKFKLGDTLEIWSFRVQVRLTLAVSR